MRVPILYPHSRPANPWIYPYIWTRILLSPLLDCKLLKGRVYVVYLCIVHYALLVLFVPIFVELTNEYEAKNIYRSECKRKLLNIYKKGDVIKE